MRIPRSWVQPMAKRVIDALIAEELIITETDKDGLVSVAEELITEDLSIEDRINDEVREILKKHDSEIEKGRLDYRRLFDITKKKLVKERNIIL